MSTRPIMGVRAHFRKQRREGVGKTSTGCACRKCLLEVSWRGRLLRESSKKVVSSLWSGGCVLLKWLLEKIKRALLGDTLSCISTLEGDGWLKRSLGGSMWLVFCVVCRDWKGKQNYESTKMETCGVVECTEKKSVELETLVKFWCDSCWEHETVSCHSTKTLSWGDLWKFHTCELEILQGNVVSSWFLMLFVTSVYFKNFLAEISKLSNIDV